MSIILKHETILQSMCEAVFPLEVGVPETILPLRQLYRALICENTFITDRVKGDPPCMIIYNPY